MSAFKLPPPCKWDLRSSGMLQTTIVRYIKSHRNEDGFEKSALRAEETATRLRQNNWSWVWESIPDTKRGVLTAPVSLHENWNVISRPAAALNLDAKVLCLGYLADGKVNSFLFPLSLYSDNFTNARFDAIAVVSVNIKRLPR
jgi:hypothetical protein